MALPKIKTQIYEFELPSKKTKIKMRPMLVKEEKILLTTKEGDESNEILSTVCQILTNCIESKIDVETLPIFDIQFLFLKLRSISTSNIVNVSYLDSEDEKTYDFKINLDKVNLKIDPKIKEVIEITDDISIQLKYPPVKIYLNNKINDMKSDEIFDLIIKNSIAKIYQGAEAYNVETSSDEEIKEFIDSIPSSAYAKIQEFFDKEPKLFHELKYKNENGKERVITLSSLEDFFTF